MQWKWAYIIVSLQVDAMKVSVKEFKREYKKINIDNIEVFHNCLRSGIFSQLQVSSDTDGNVSILPDEHTITHANSIRLRTAMPILLPRNLFKSSN